LRLAWLALLFAAAADAEVSRVESAVELQQKGKLKEARELLQNAIPALRTAGDQRQLARALNVSGQISVSLGDYRAAIQEATQALDLHRALKDDTNLAEDFNTLGLAHLYLANYPTALDYYQQALLLDRAHAKAQGEITRLNNIANVYYFQGRYLDAINTYQAALGRVMASSAEPWYARRRQLVIANLASLYQRLGKEQTALEYYQQLARAPQAMPPSEQAQLLLNQGVLYRRLGDPIKALELYQASQRLFAIERHRDGEIGALRNIGIARAVDLGDMAGAFDAFSAALRLARESSNSRGAVQASLYRAEVLYRLRRPREAESDARLALEGAERTGLVEEQWKALYALGQIAEAGGRREAALDFYRRAIAIVESVRAGLRLTVLKTDFLADKRDVYDALIALRVREDTPSVKELFRWMERSRARTLQERTASGLPELSLEAMQARLPADTAVLEFWSAKQATAMLWITQTGAGLERIIGQDFLAHAPLPAHVIIVPDGPLSTVAFETLKAPASGRLLIEESTVSYLPSAQFLLRPTPRRGWLPPWRRELVAFGDPPVSAADTLAQSERWQKLTASADEVNGIAGMLAGRTELHLGADARKSYLLGRRLESVPLIHFSTHGVVDLENPERSRILLAPDVPGMPSDYLFEEEVYNLDLKGVDLVTVSACDTARGKFVGGEGMEAFSRAFLAAGASATVTTLWRVADRPAADFMQQLYYFLARGQSKAEALRAAKLRFLHSNSTLADSRYWGAFVLNGDGWNPTRRAVPWAWPLLAAGAIAALLALWLRLNRRKRCHQVVSRKSEHLNRLAG
jgi:tetratricopeptide (TPR) repeat protein